MVSTWWPNIETYFRFLILAFLVVQATIKTMKMTVDGGMSYGPSKPGARPEVAQITSMYVLHTCVYFHGPACTNTFLRSICMTMVLLFFIGLLSLVGQCTMAMPA
jgi:hypothetical protein